MPPTKAAPASMETTLGAIVAHPTRARSFTILSERTASPVEIAQEIGKDVGHVGYHVRKLLELNLIELVDERPVRGAVEHFYRAIERPVVTEEEFARQSVAEREVFTRHILQLAVADAARAMDEHTLDARPDRVVTRMLVLVDEEGFQELGELYTEALERTMEIQARSAERLTTSGEEGISTSTSSMFFEVPATSAQRVAAPADLAARHPAFTARRMCPSACPAAYSLWSHADRGSTDRV